MGARRSIPRPYHYKESLLQATYLLFVVDLILIPRFKAIMGFTRPLWILLGHYGSAIIGSASHVIKHRHECP